MKRFTWTSVVAIALAFGCYKLDPVPDRPDASSDSDADTDADTDTDTDVDSDVDTGTDSDTDTDTDSDTDTDTDTDTDSDTDTDTDLLEWIAIPGGTFQMGSAAGETNETPVHSVTVPDFEMLKTEVTVTQYEACVTATACTIPLTSGVCTATSLTNWGATGREGHPVNCVDWQQAADYCEWIGGRLPSEAEWEYAARSGGQDIDYPWGDEPATCEYAVMSEGGSGCGTGHTMETCSKTAGNTDQGLCDVAGNVWEWVEDAYHDSYAGAPSDGSAWTTGGSENRIIRGGSWDFADPVDLRASNRLDADPSDGSYNVGVRCSRDG